MILYWSKQCCTIQLAPSVGRYAVYIWGIVSSWRSMVSSFIPPGRPIVSKAPRVARARMHNPIQIGRIIRGKLDTCGRLLAPVTGLSRGLSWWVILAGCSGVVAASAEIRQTVNIRDSITNRVSDVCILRWKAATNSRACAPSMLEQVRHLHAHICMVVFGAVGAGLIGGMASCSRSPCHRYSGSLFNQTRGPEAWQRFVFP